MQKAVSLRADRKAASGDLAEELRIPVCDIQSGELGEGCHMTPYGEGVQQETGCGSALWDSKEEKENRRVVRAPQLMGAPSFGCHGEHRVVATA